MRVLSCACTGSSCISLAMSTLPCVAWYSQTYLVLLNLKSCTGNGGCGRKRNKQKTFSVRPVSCVGLQLMNNTLKAPSLSEAEVFGGIWHQCVPVSGVICWGHKPMLGELNDYKEKAKCGNSNILRGLICRDLSTRSMWETGGMAYN